MATYRKILFFTTVLLSFTVWFDSPVEAQCTAPSGFSLISPANGATGVSTAPTLTWNVAPGAGSYIVHIGTNNPPSPLNDQTVTGTSFSPANSVIGPLGTGLTYYWSVDAVAACDSTKRTTGTGGIRSFTVGCANPGSFSLQSPAAGAMGVSTTATLTWNAASGAGSYIVHIGTNNPPSPLNDQTVTGTSFSPANSVIGPLGTGLTYYWSVDAVAACDFTRRTSNIDGIRFFSTGTNCFAPGSFSLISPTNGAAGVGTSPTFTWNAAAGATYYIVHIGTNNPPSPLNDQIVTGTSFSPANSVIGPLGAGLTYYWSVDAVIRCQDGSIRATPNTGGIATFSVDPPHCSQSDVTLCLASQRFRVDVSWRDSSGRTGQGHVVPYSTPDSGIFWFFGSNNWELMVKVLDACAPPFRRFWVFSAATTNVEYTLTVTDTLTGRVRQYHNLQGQAAPAVNDTDAFDTCP